jgi:hypothetical protein
MQRMTRRSSSLSALGGGSQGADASPLSSSTEERVGVRSRWLPRHLLAGLCCGLAISSEYTAATAAGGVLALALLTSWRRGLFLAAAAIPPLLLIPAYNWVCFGGPLAFGYHHLALTEFQGMNKGLFGITWPPKASAAYLILLSPERGLFFWTPFFLMAFAGVRSLNSSSRNLAWFCLSVTLVHVIAISGYYMPNGGAALGPRHLAPLIPFAAIISAFGSKTNFSTGVVLGTYSLLLTGFGTFIDAMPPENANNLIVDFYLPSVQSNSFAVNFLSVTGADNLHSRFMAIFLVVVGFVCAAYMRLLFAPQREAKGHSISS